jgi:hypothetical protein
MINGDPSVDQIPIRYADIIFADVLDPNGENPKIRRMVVLTPDAALASGFPIVVAAVTGTLPTPLTSDYVVLPYKNPPGRHPKTGLTKKAAVLCSWIVKSLPIRSTADQDSCRPVSWISLTLRQRRRPSRSVDGRSRVRVERPPTISSRRSVESRL